MPLDAEAARQLHNRLHEVLGEREARRLMELFENLASRSDVDALGAQLHTEMDHLGTQLRTEMAVLRHELTGAFHKDLLAAVTGQTRSIIYANLGLVFASVSLAFAAARFAG